MAKDVLRCGDITAAERTFGEWQAPRADAEVAAGEEDDGRRLVQADAAFARHGLVLRVSGAFIVNVDAVPSTDWEFRERRFEKTKRDSRSG